MLVAAFVLLGFVVMLVVGLPLVARIADHQLYRAPTAPRDPTTRRTFQARTITPPDFGPVRMKWPSDTPRPEHDRRSRPELYWPSSRWDDPSFGKSAANRKAEAASARAEAGAEQAQKRWAAAAQSAMPPLASDPAPSTARNRPTPQGSPRPARGARTTPPSRPVGPPARPRAERPAPQAEPRGSDPASPSAEEIRALIREHGSVAASRILAQHTGLPPERVVDIVLDAMKG